jgi:hypothetical protein
MPTTLAPASVTLEGKYALYKPQGEFTLAEITAAIDDAIIWCRRERIRGLLADVREAVFERPTVAQRFAFISRWADLAGPSVVIAVCAKPAMILEDKFGVIIANNRGMIADAFSDIYEATKWLTDRMGGNGPSRDASN